MELAIPLVWMLILVFGTQTSYLDSDPTRPGIQLPGSAHYSSAYDTNPYLSGTQVPGSYKSYY